MEKKGLYGLILLLAGVLPGCANKKITMKKVWDGTINVHWYQENTIGKGKDVVMANRAGDYELILETGSQCITDIGLKGDTVSIKLFHPGEHPIDRKKHIAQGYIIQYDTTATQQDYDKVYPSIHAK